MALRVPYLASLNKPPGVPKIGIAMGNVEARFSVGLVIFVSAVAADKFLCSVAASPWLWRHSWRWHWGPLSEAPCAWARPRPLSHQLQPPNALQFSQGAPVIPLRLTHGEACGITLRRRPEFLTVNSLGVATVSVSPVPVHLPKRHFWTVLHPGLAFRILPLSRSVRFQLNAAKTHWYHLSRALRYWKPCELQHIGEYELDFVPSTKFLLELIRSQSVAVSEAPFHSHFLELTIFVFLVFSFLYLILILFGWCVTQKQQFWSCLAYPSPLPR